MLENEIKKLVKKDEYYRICLNLENKYEKKEFIQINYYYDTKKFDLANEDITLRVRQKEDSLMLQMKYPVYHINDLSVKQEFEEKVDILPLIMDIGKYEWANILKYKGEVELIGSLITNRKVFMIDKGIEFCADTNYYLGITDFEIEVEFEKELEILAYEIIERLDIDECHKGFGRGKRERFLKAYIEAYNVANHYRP